MIVNKIILNIDLCDEGINELIKTYNMELLYKPDFDKYNFKFIISKRNLYDLLKEIYGIDEIVEIKLIELNKKYNMYEYLIIN